MAAGCADRLLSGVDLETICEGGLEWLVVVLSQFRDTLVGLGELVWNDAKHIGLCLRFPLTHQLDVSWTSVYHTHIHCSIPERERGFKCSLSLH